MPHINRKKKTTTGKQASEPEEASVSEGEATAEAEETKSDVNPSILSALSKITDNITKSLDAKVDTVLAAIHEQTACMQALATRVGDAETRISGVEDTVDVLQAKVTKLEKQTTDMAEHIDDLENRSRRCNLRLVGCPRAWTEKMESLSWRNGSPPISISQLKLGRSSWTALSAPQHRGWILINAADPSS